MRRFRAPQLAALAAAAAALLASGCNDAEGAEGAMAAESTAGDWLPWVLESGSQIGVPPPPQEGSQAARRDAEELDSAMASRSERDEERARELQRKPALEPWLQEVMSYTAATLER